MDRDRQTNRRSRAFRRRAFALLAVLIALAVVAVLVTGWIGSGIGRRAHARQAEQRLQADWLAESGLDRAAARLAANASYTGEVWNIPGKELSGPDGATVDIRVAPTGDSAKKRVTAVADYPADPQRRSRVSKDVVLGP